METDYSPAPRGEDELDRDHGRGTRARAVDAFTALCVSSLLLLKDPLLGPEDRTQVGAWVSAPLGDRRDYSCPRAARELCGGQHSHTPAHRNTCCPDSDSGAV